MKWDGIRPSYREQLPPVIVAQVYHSIPLNGEWSDLTATLSAELDNDRIPIVLHEIHVFYWRMQLPVRCRQLAGNSHRGSLRRWLRKGCSSVGFMYFDSMTVWDKVLQLPKKEKLMLMEALWEDLSRDEESLESPAWHAQVLAEREKSIEDGSAEFLTVNEARAELKKSRKG